MDDLDDIEVREVYRARLYLSRNSQPSNRVNDQKQNLDG